MAITEDVDKILAEAKQAARGKIEARLRTLKRDLQPLLDERDQLQAKLAEIDGKPISDGGRRKPSQRLSLDERARQVIEAVKANGELNIADLSREIGLGYNRTVAIVKDMRAAGTLAKGTPLRLS